MKTIDISKFLLNLSLTHLKIDSVIIVKTHLLLELTPLHLFLLQEFFIVIFLER